MISRNLFRRVEKLERQLRARTKDMQPEMQDEATTNLLRRLNQARRRMAQGGDERYAAYRDLAPEPEYCPPFHESEIVTRLNAARFRTNRENMLARQTEVAEAARDESKPIEP
jgi:hypothetical protein